MGSDLGNRPENVVEILGTLAQNWKNESLDVGRQACERNFGFLDVVMPIS